MCGIWGIVNKKKILPIEVISNIMKELMLLSESRGKEATGVVVLNSEGMSVIKRSVAANVLLRSDGYRNFLKKNMKANEELLLMGHSRLVTNGVQSQNNQPVVKHKMAMVHNGIIVNDAELWSDNTSIEREYEIDTEIMVELFNKYLKEENCKAALSRVYGQIQGMASTISILMEQKTLIAASNNGSLYYCVCKDSGVVILASEMLTVQKVLHKFKSHLGGRNIIRQLNHGGIVSWSLKETVKEAQVIIDDDINSDTHARYNIFGEKQISQFEIDFEKIKKIRRCTRCVLPETMPFIHFDEKGVCNYCRTYQKQIYKGEDALKKWARNINKEKTRNNCMVSFSGGRDSSYGLHYFVKELGLKPITYCYDWGMVTDLARRNQSRMCSKLGVELILVSADIRRKRSNIRKNILAWLKEPDLGMIPIFMAGDKHYFYYANKVCKDYGINNILLASNPFEKTYFKSGFCGIKPEILCGKDNKLAVERLPFAKVAQTGLYYLGQYGKNRAYINDSLIDTFTAAISYYIIPHNYFRLFDYIEWEESKVNRVLLDEYDWEIATDTKSTWRIGDGTAPFYNYIYCLVAGFSENDTLRSNQIREGMLTREEALDLVYRDNVPRFDSMKWYFDVLNLDMQGVLSKVQRMSRLYGQ